MMTEMFDPSVPEKVSGRLAQNEKRLAVSENVAARQCIGRSEPTRLILATGQKRRSSIAGDRSGLGRGTPSFYGLGHSRRHGGWARLSQLGHASLSQAGEHSLVMSYFGYSSGRVAYTSYLFCLLVRLPRKPIIWSRG